MKFYNTLYSMQDSLTLLYQICRFLHFFLWPGNCYSYVWIRTYSPLKTVSSIQRVSGNKCFSLLHIFKDLLLRKPLASCQCFSRILIFPSHSRTVSTTQCFKDKNRLIAVLAYQRNRSSGVCS